MSLVVNMNNNISSDFRLFPRKTKNSFQKNPKILSLVSFWAFSFKIFQLFTIVSKIRKNKLQLNGPC